MSRILMTVAAAALGIGLVACKGPATMNPAALDPSQAARPVVIDSSGTLPAASPTRIHTFKPVGEYLHGPTGFSFPARAGALIRTSVTEYDEAREDVSAEYRMKDTGHPLLITAYVFPVWRMVGNRITMADVPEICSGAFRGAASDMVRRLSSPSVVRDEAITDSRFTDAILHHALVYDATGSTIGIKGPQRTALYYHCGIDRVWIVQYRVTYSTGLDVATLVQQLMDTVPVPRKP